MKTPVSDYLEELLDNCAADASGATADYIPELAAVNPDQFGVAIATPDGTTYRAGDSDVPFTIQSISKAFTYAIALQDRGIDAVLERVGTEPTGDAFNEISLESDTGRPRNPMVNVGAITTHGLIGGPSASPSQRFELIRYGLSAFAGRMLDVDEDVFNSELETADRNRSLAFMVRSYGIIESDPLEVVREYTRQCALLVTTEDLAMMGATLANGGVHPVSRERVVSASVIRQTLSVMMTCGMYNAAGDWVSTVGIPAKSGVSGGILGVLPGEVGIGTFSPRLDKYGNSVRGVRLCQRLSQTMGMHLMATPPRGPVGVRSIKQREVQGAPASIVVLQGAVHFSEAEQALRALMTIPVSEEPVYLELRRVSEVNDVARRMLLEGVRRLRLDGRPVTLVDPDGVLHDPDLGDGSQPPPVIREIPRT